MKTIREKKERTESSEGCVLSIRRLFQSIWIKKPSWVSDRLKIEIPLILELFKIGVNSAMCV